VTSNSNSYMAYRKRNYYYSLT